MKTEKTILRRWGILAVGVFTMLFAGIIYAWSILKIPFAEEIGYEASALALNFTLTMCFFCLGGLLSSRLIKLVGTRFSIVIAGLLAGVGFVLSGLVGEKGIALLYVTYALMAGLGIGIAYIVIISAVNAWFPDRRGLSSGALMMGFGGSSLILGNLADKMFQSSLGWKNPTLSSALPLAWFWRSRRSSLTVPMKLSRSRLPRWGRESAARTLRQRTTSPPK